MHTCPRADYTHLSADQAPSHLTPTFRSTPTPTTSSTGLSHNYPGQGHTRTHAHPKAGHACRPWHPHTHPRAPSLTQTRLHTPWSSAAESSCGPSPTGSSGAPISSTTGLGGLRPGQAVGPQRGLSAIFPARAAHLPRSHQPARHPARRHCPSSPTARCAPAPGGSRPPLQPQPALHVLGLRRWSSARRPRVPRHQAQPPASDSAPARMLAPPGGAAREAAMRLRHRAAPREPQVSLAWSEAPPPMPH